MHVLLTCKGAPEVLLTGGRLTDPQPVRSAARYRSAASAGDGYRVLAVAHRVLDAPPDDLADAKSGLRLLVPVAIAPPSVGCHHHRDLPRLPS